MHFKSWMHLTMAWPVLVFPVGISCHILLAGLCAQPMRDSVTLYRHLSLTGRKPKISPALCLHANTWSLHSGKLGIAFSCQGPISPKFFHHNSNFALIQVIVNELLWNFAHGMTAMLSCYVQNFIMIWYPAVELHYNQISIKFELWLKKSLVKWAPWLFTSG